MGSGLSPSLDPRRHHSKADNSLWSSSSRDSPSRLQSSASEPKSTTQMSMTKELCAQIWSRPERSGLPPRDSPRSSRRSCPCCTLLTSTLLSTRRQPSTSRMELGRRRLKSQLPSMLCDRSSIGYKFVLINENNFFYSIILKVMWFPYNYH